MFCLFVCFVTFSSSSSSNNNDGDDGDNVHLATIDLSCFKVLYITQGHMINIITQILKINF